MASRVRVLRAPIKPRNSLDGLTGIMVYEAEVKAPIHVGGPVPVQMVPESVRRNFLNRLRGTRDAREAVKVIEGHLDKLFPRSAGRGQAGQIFRLSGSPTIPGTSLKGIVRSRVEFMLRADERGEVPSCFSVVNGRPFVARRGQHGWRHQMVYPASLEDRGPSCNAIRFNTVCDVCNIFGAPGLASRVYFGPLIFDTTIETVRTQEGVYEFIPRGARAVGWLTFRGLDPQELGLVMLGMGIGDGPILVGRWRYRGVMGKRVGRLSVAVNRWKFHEASSRALSQLGVLVSDVQEVARVLIERAREAYRRWLKEVREDEVLESIE